MTDTEQERIKAICKVAHIDDISDLSDGYHTFKQLYYQRMMLFAALVKQNRDKAWKSLRHEDGELCFGGGWFIVGIDTPEGSYTYHYEDNYFSLFDCVELERGKKWDGHTEKDVTRLLSLGQESCDNVCEWFEQYVDIATDIVELRFSDGAVKRAKRGLYMRDIEKSIRKMLIDQIVDEKKQEPCTDAISRQAALESIKNLYPDMPVVNIFNAKWKWLEKYAPYFKCENAIEHLSSVTPAEKVGHWVKTIGENGVTSAVRCSKCGFEDNRYMLFRYCPNCSAKMQEVEE